MRMFFWGFALSLITLFGLTYMAKAEPVCGPTEQVLVALAERYSELSAARGFLGDGSILMVTATADGSSWTLLQITPAGQTCMMAGGTGWEMVPPPPAGQEG